MGMMDMEHDPISHSPPPIPHDAAVVIPAAGSGSRMGGVPKQFRMLGDAPVLVQTVRAFQQHPAIGPIVVATGAEMVGEVQALLSEYDAEAEVVFGSATRQASVGQGLAALPAAVEIVLVHDAVRPFIVADRIAAVVDAARTHGAAALAMPVADTLRRGEADGFGATVDRENLWRMQTPQAARLDLLRDAHARAVADDYLGTDEVELLQRIGQPVHRIVGDARNLKLTHPEDWAVAQALWPVWLREERG